MVISMSRFVTVLIAVPLVLATSVVGGEYLRNATPNQSAIDVDTLKAALRTDDTTAIKQAINRAKQSQDSPGLAQFIKELWNRDEHKYPDLPWDTIRSPAVMSEVANFLAQASINGLIEIDLRSIQAYARSLLKDNVTDGATTAIFTLGLIDDAGDADLLVGIAAKENPRTFRAAALALARSCHSTSRGALQNLKARIRDSEDLRFIEDALSQSPSSRNCK